MTVNGQSRTRLNLHPPELGQIQIEISLESNKLSATVITETQVVKELMESNLGQLRQHLAQHNLRLENFQVTVGTDTPAYKESHQGFLGNGKHSRQNIVADTTAVGVEQESSILDQPRALHTGARIDLFA
jgi:flagellar hook-length control protein FliK